MLSTKSNLDNQKELDEFFSLISPSLRIKVSHHIINKALEKNPIFKGREEIIEFLINDLVTLLYLPEDNIIN